MRLVRAKDTFALIDSGITLATAEGFAGVWAVQTAGGAPMTLVSFEADDESDVVLFDSELNVVASLHPHAGISSAAVLRNARDELSAIIRADGSGGLYAMTPGGDVLFFAGHSPHVRGALDLLITDAGSGYPLAVLFALSVALKTKQLAFPYQLPN